MEKRQGMPLWLFSRLISLAAFLMFIVAAVSQT
jgi:hypothetical protein